MVCVLSLEAGALGTLQSRRPWCTVSRQGLCQACPAVWRVLRHMWVRIDRAVALCVSPSMNWALGFNSNVCCAAPCCPVPAGGSGESRCGSARETRGG